MYTHTHTHIYIYIHVMYVNEACTPTHTNTQMLTWYLTSFLMGSCKKVVACKYIWGRIRAINTAA